MNHLFTLYDHSSQQIGTDERFHFQDHKQARKYAQALIGQCIDGEKIVSVRIVQRLVIGWINDSDNSRDNDIICELCGENAIKILY